MDIRFQKQFRTQFIPKNDMFLLLTFGKVYIIQISEFCQKNQFQSAWYSIQELNTITKCLFFHQER